MHIISPTMKSLSDTIAAITTATGNGGIAIVRLSGPNSIAIADTVFRGRSKKPSELQRNSFLHGHIRGKEQSEDLDEVVLLVFRAPNSYTREDVVEIQGHGGRACAQRIMRAVLDSGARMAEPGEFTKRAFLNGRIDLIQAEAVMDLIQASSERAASAAFEQLSGSLSGLFEEVYDILIAVASDLETTLDFSDQELPTGVLNGIGLTMQQVILRLNDALATWEEGHILRDGALIVITGAANVGKSTLLNRLLDCDRAIVTDIPGTTRDIIEEQIVINGVSFRLFDTAGIRDSDCHIEREGISRAKDLLSRADIVLYIVDSTASSFSQDIEKLKLLKKKQPIVIFNKQDICPVIPETFADFSTIPCSLINGTGLDKIRETLSAIADSICNGPPHAVISERHRHIIQYVLNHITEAEALLRTNDEATIVLAASHLRAGLERLGTINGRIYSNELLDNIFNRFCIGK